MEPHYSGIEMERIKREERAANFLDQFILKVGNRKKESSTLLEKSMTPDFFSSMKNPKFKKTLLGLQTLEDRVEFIVKHFTGVRIPPEVLNKYQKNSETSRQLRDHGNDLFQRRNFETALHYYNLALMFAEIKTEAFGMACANRSAVLVELGHFEEAIEDVELALKNKYPESRIQKLVERRTRCRDLIRKKQEEYLALDSQIRKEVEKEMQQMKEMRNEMLSLKKPNPVIPAAAEVVELKSDPVLGRQLVVNCDVGAGTVLIVEAPFMFALHEHCRWHMDHCHYCLKRIRRGIPCENCVFAIYCNESCRAEATKIHHYECRCLPSFHYLHLLDNHMLACRVILNVGPKELFRLFETRDPSYFSQQQPYGIGPGCVYDSKSYHAVFHLPTHSDNLHFVYQTENAHFALITTTILGNETQFFEEVPTECRPAFEKFIAALMVRHMEANYVPDAREIESLENISLADSYAGKISPQKFADVIEHLKCPRSAGALYPVVSLLNHSCDPNVTGLCHTTNGIMIILAKHALKKGQPLLISYTTGNFLLTEIGSRQAELQERHYFKCHCSACEMKLPTIYHLNHDPTFCCPACSKEFFEYEKMSSAFRKCVLAAPNWKCGRCGKTFTGTGLNVRMQIANDMITTAVQSLHSVRPRKAHDLFLKNLDFLQFNTCPPNVQFYVAQDLLTTALSVLFFYAQT